MLGNSKQRMMGGSREGKRCPAKGDSGFLSPTRAHHTWLSTWLTGLLTMRLRVALSKKVSSSCMLYLATPRKQVNSFHYPCPGTTVTPGPEQTSRKQHSKMCKPHTHTHNIYTLSDPVILKTYHRNVSLGKLIQRKKKGP